MRLSEPVVEAGIYDSPAGSALVLANFTYAPIPSLAVEFPTRAPISTVKSFAHGELPVATVPGPSALEGGRLHAPPPLRPPARR